METAGKRVLVAEDDRFLRRACEMSLRHLGFTAFSSPRMAKKP